MLRLLEWGGWPRLKVQLDALAALHGLDDGADLGHGRFGRRHGLLVVEVLAHELELRTANSRRRGSKHGTNWKHALQAHVQLRTSWIACMAQKNETQRLCNAPT